MAKPQPAPQELACAFISLLLILILFPLAETIRIHAPVWVYRAVAGFLLGTVGAFSWATLQSLYSKVKQGGLAAIEDNLWLRLFSIVLYVIIALLGAITWVAAWEGTTGVAYGAGVFIGAGLMEFGAGGIIKKGL
ncbi:hypothetical protein [Burkholderia singularis]|uniref:Transmembrane protein n=1 Tax=Burkholderia singularis TaxID=1503053 RepID=A0A238GZ51_9BURK|nr:hypothetical protein [Burkholderia singularis]SMF98223.1 hypothetical protein BSIN_1514 [Burkholderia singularis]